MFRIYAVILSIVLQLIATAIALGLTRRTRYRISWILISLGFMVMTIRRCIDLYLLLYEDDQAWVQNLFDWLAILISLLITAGVIFIPEIFNYIQRAERSREISEKRILNAIVRTEEKERKRFAQDMHDGLGPILSAIKLSLSSLQKSITGSKENEILLNAEHLVDEAIKSTKETSNNLSPYYLNHFGLFKALQLFLDNIRKTDRINTDLRGNIEDLRFDANKEVTLYRICCELVSNTLRHARAKNILISIYLEEDMLEFVYYDDGRGMPVEEVLEGKKGGMGWQNILSRVRSLGGRIEVSSPSGEGSRIAITLSIYPDKEIMETKTPLHP